MIWTWRTKSQRWARLLISGMTNEGVVQHIWSTAMFRLKRSMTPWPEVEHVRICCIFLPGISSTCAMGLTNRMMGCLCLNMANICFRNFPWWLVRVILVVLGVLPVSRPRPGKNSYHCDCWIWHGDHRDILSKTSCSLIQALELLSSGQYGWEGINL